jgi:hypothetical protein
VKGLLLHCLSCFKTALEVKKIIKNLKQKGMNSSKLKVGDKVVAFEFEHSLDLAWNDKNMRPLIGQVGTVISVEKKIGVALTFGNYNNWWWYPLNHEFAVPYIEDKLGKPIIKVGNKVLGFKYEDLPDLSYSPLMDEYIGKEGIITAVGINVFYLRFEDEGKSFRYPVNHKLAIPYVKTNSTKTSETSKAFAESVTDYQSYVGKIFLIDQEMYECKTIHEFEDNTVIVNGRLDFKTLNWVKNVYS